MAESYFSTDFSSLVDILSARRNRPGPSLLLSQTRYPNPLERVAESSVRSMISILNKDINDIQDAKEDIARLNAFLQDSLDELQAKIFEYRSLVAPIRRLPVEILQEIFRVAEACKTQTQARRNPPPVVAQVNRHWRHVALATPSLWTALTLTVGTERMTAQLESLARITTRSHPLPVTFVIQTVKPKLPYRYLDAHEEPEAQLQEHEFEDYDYYGDYLDEWEIEEQRRVERNNGLTALGLRLDNAAKLLAERALEPHLHRLGCIIMLRYSDALQAFINRLEEVKAIPSLSSLECLVVPEVTWAEDRSLPFRLAPHLTRLCINPRPLSVPFSGPWEAIPWSKLVAFRGPLSRSELAICFSSNSTTLRMAEIIVQHFTPSLPGQSPAHSPLPNLTSLSLRAIPHNTGPLPPLPALRHLLFQPDSRPVPRFTASFPQNGDANLNPLILSLLNAWGRRLHYFGIDTAFTSISNNLDPQDTLDAITATAPDLEALGIPTSWHTLLDRIVPRHPRLAHIELFDAKEAPTHLQDISYRALGHLQTLTFLEHSEGTGRLLVRNAETKARAKGLGVVVSRQLVRPLMRFSTPYFIQKGGIFGQCLSDEITRQRYAENVSNGV